MKSSLVEFLKGYIRTIEDYPVKGVSFKDISPLLANIKTMKISIKGLNEMLPNGIITAVMGIESRGFIFGSILSVENKASFIMIRKASKLTPVVTNVVFRSKSEYSEEKLGFDSSLLGNGIILVHDDVLATGGTSRSVVEALRNNCGIKPENIYLSFLVELSFLQGRDNLLKEELIPETNIKSVIVY